MGFRDEFLWTDKTYAEWSLENTTKAGFSANQERLAALQNSVKSTFEQGIDRLAQSQAESSAALRGELAYQAERINEQIAQSSRAVVSAVERGSANIVESIQQMSDYLGSELCEVRWAVERHTEVSERILNVLLNSLNNESRQYFEQGVKCYESSESDLAKERLVKALEANRTNYFAYQYLGFIAVADDDPDEAMRNFDLARKFAESEYYQALALSHLARSSRAVGDIAKAVNYSEAAVKAHPQTAKFWYELATYCAQAGQNSQAISALKEAIERDWMYWTVVSADSDFDKIRNEVIDLLNRLREREKGKAQHSLDNLKRAIDTAQRVGAGSSLSSCTGVYKKLEMKFRQNNVFLFREIVPEASKCHESAFKNAEKAVADRIAEYQKQSKEFHASVHELEAKRSNVGAGYKKWKPEGLETAAWVMLWLVYVIIVSVLLGKFLEMLNLDRDWGILGVENGNVISVAGMFALCTSPIVLLTPYILDKLKFRREVTTPRERMGDQIVSRRNEVEQQQKKIEDEVTLLKGVSEKLLKREYI